MRAVLFDRPGHEDVLHVGETAAPPLGPRDLRIRVMATAVNRADLLQRRGLYPPPPGASQILGLECAGEVMETGAEVHLWRRGDRVMALLSGGGYAEEAVVHEGSAMPAPESLSWEEAAAIPETFLTAFLNVFLLGRVRAGGSALVHGGGSGVGTSAIALCHEAGVRIFVTAGSDEKCQRCREHGADVAINYRTEYFPDVIRRETEGAGVDVIVDHMGATYLSPDVEALAMDGRIVFIGTMGESIGSLDVSQILRKRAHLIGSTLRGRTVDEKGGIVSDFLDRFGQSLSEGRLRPVVDQVFPLEEAADAHRAMNAPDHFGKIVLRVG